MTIRRFFKRLRSSVTKRLGLPANRDDALLRKCRGVIHVGANTGMEASYYAQRKLNVVWYEPIPSIYEKLVKNVRPFPNQRAVKALLTDQKGQVRRFNISDNEGFSSSILELKGHKAMWPEVGYSSTVELTTTTLAESVKDNRIDMNSFDALVLDTQGSELLVLQGAESLLGRFRYIKAEAADFEAYEGCAQLPEIVAWLGARGFRPVVTEVMKSVPGLGTYYDVTFTKDAQIIGG